MLGWLSKASRTGLFAKYWLKLPSVNWIVPSAYEASGYDKIVDIATFATSSAASHGTMCLQFAAMRISSSG